MRSGGRPRVRSLGARRRDHRRRCRSCGSAARALATTGPLRRAACRRGPDRPRRSSRSRSTPTAPTATMLSRSPRIRSRPSISGSRPRSLAILAPAARAVRTLAGTRPGRRPLRLWPAAPGTARAGAAPRPAAARLDLSWRSAGQFPHGAALAGGDPRHQADRARRRAPPGHLVHLGDDAGQVVAAEEDPADTFDPRTRPWYDGAGAADGLFWTDVYVFFTSQAAGPDRIARDPRRRGRAARGRGRRHHAR